MLNPMLDKEFLKELDKTSLKEVYVEIYALNSDDEIIESIEGHVTQGSINIDGASSVRRTCSLTIVADELNIHEYYWGLHTKFKLSLGLKNEIDDRYPDIIWFKQGTFVISSFSTSQAISNYIITIQGKDKMTLLNGEMGGIITGLTHDFGSVLISNKFGYTTEEKLLIRDIIIGAVHQFANEPFHNIIINDLEDIGLELLEYRGEKPLYIVIDETSKEFENMTLNEKTTYYTENGNIITIDKIPSYNPLFDLEQSGIVSDYTIVYSSRQKENPKSIAKIEYGQTAGYRITDLVYAGDLILNVGETVTSMLDKIIKMLGDFEYFYDIDGRFIFQRKKTYFYTSWNNIVNNMDEQYIENSVYTSAISYSFEDGMLISSYNNNPNIANIRNDFSVWGTRKSVTGQEIPVHMRYAIDKKPTFYITYDDKCYTSMSKKEMNSFIKEHSLNKNNFYNKKKNPKGLSEDWWDIFDWAEYYKKCVGEYPNGSLGDYCSGGGVQFAPKEMYDMFPKGSETTTYFEKKPIYIFDVEADGTLGYTNHGTHCTHKYTDYFIKELLTRGATAFIYKPVMPIELKDKEQEVITGREFHYNLDWREIIYQMALDYNKHHLKDDYHIKMAEKNYGYYSNGKTGYEQYYVDMEGFWRQLYCPIEEYEGAYETIFLGKKQYLSSPETYYYGKPNYIQCKTDDIFHSTMTYYSYIKDDKKDAYVLKPVEDLYRFTFESNKENYYYIDPSNPTAIENCIVIEPYRLSGKGYYNENGVEINQVNEIDYEKNPQNYYYNKGIEYLPCVEIEPYYSTKQYCRSDGKIISNVVSEDYYAHPFNYYYKKYSYTQCNNNSKFDYNTRYYIEIYSSITKVRTYSIVKSLTPEVFNENKTNYYTRNENPSIICCANLLRQYDPKNSYSQQIEDEKGNIIYKNLNISNEADFRKKANEAGNLYYNKIIFESCKHPIEFSSSLTFYVPKENSYSESGWLKEVYTNPEGLNFWFDFLDEDSELQKFGCYAIGDRPKGVNDNQVKAIYFRETPTVIFVNNDEWDSTDKSKLGYTYLKLPSDMESLFTISAQGKSAKSVVDEYIYKYACGAESITISVLPIYHLEPNTRIFVRNDESGINGEYILVRYSITLGTGGNMSISAEKAVDRLY